MRATEIREMTPEERKARLEDLIEEYRGMRFGHVMQQLSDPLMLRKTRRDIARLKSIIAQAQSQRLRDKQESRPEAGTEAAEGEEA